MQALPQIPSSQGRHPTHNLLDLQLIGCIPRTLYKEELDHLRCSRSVLLDQWRRNLHDQAPPRPAYSPDLIHARSCRPPTSPSPRDRSLSSPRGSSSGTPSAVSPCSATCRASAAPAPAAALSSSRLELLLPRRHRGTARAQAVAGARRAMAAGDGRGVVGRGRGKT